MILANLLPSLEAPLGSKSRHLKDMISYGLAIIFQAQIIQNSLESFYGQRLPFGKFLVLDDFYDRPALAWLATQALQEFFASNGSFPKPYNEAQASQVLELVKKINAQAGDETFSEDEVDSKYLLQLINPAFGSLCPISSLIGGLVANQCITAISAKWTPLNQWLFFDAVSVLPEGLTEESVNLVCSLTFQC